MAKCFSKVTVLLGFFLISRDIAFGFKRNEGRSYFPQSVFKEIRTDNGATWTFRGSQAMSFTNMSHKMNPISEDVFLNDPDKPMFDKVHSLNVTGQLGKTAVLNCRVKNISNNTVSWVRHRDIHLLTVGKFTYTTDQRFNAVHSDGSEDWLLKIHYLQDRDIGWYECQISSTPPRSHMIFLSVVEPETVILGGPDVYINQGSRIALTCSVKHSPEAPAFIFWYHNEKLVSYDRTRGGVHVQTEKGHISTSRLIVQYAGPQHSGIYTCSPANSKPKTVNVHVLPGEKPAAIQHVNNSVDGLISAHAPHSFHMLSSVTTLSILSLTYIFRL